MAANVLTDSKTPAIIVTEIKMMNSTFNGVHFLVEGENDIKFWKTRIAKGRTAIVNCEGKTNLLGASQIISHQNIPNVVGVYDSDYDGLFGVAHYPNMLTPTDENDLEVTLLASQALYILLNEYADESLLNAFQNDNGFSAVEHLEKMSQEFGKLRLLNKVLEHNVDFNQLSPYKFVSQDHWILDKAGLHAEYAMLASISVDKLNTALSSIIPIAKSWGLCQGHDSVKILAQGLRKKIGKKPINDQDLAKVLRIAYSPEMLRQSLMYKSLRILEATLTVPIFDC